MSKVDIHSDAICWPMISTNNTPFAAIGFEQWHRDSGTMACVAV